MSETIRLFIGTSPNGEDYEAEAVAAYTAQKFSSLPIEITWMRASKRGPYSGWKLASGRTPFSAFRWSPPAMCGFTGRAIYTDVDFVFHADLAELWTEAIPGVIVTKRPKPAGKIKSCCTLFDCAKAKGHVADLDGLRRMDDPQGHYTNYFKDRPALVSNFQSGDWNAIDSFDVSNPRIKATHYSRMEHQVHLRHAIARLKARGKSHWYTGPVFAHPNADLQKHFDAMLIEAQAAGVTYDSFQYGSGVDISRRNFTYKTHKGTGGARVMRPVDLYSSDYIHTQRVLHAAPNGYGGRGDKWSAVVAELAQTFDAHSVLDYGCGQGRLVATLKTLAPALACREYDPAIPGKDMRPGFADLVTCTDVLEHIEPACLDAVMTHLKQLARKAVFVVIATRPSSKILTDGRNAHLILENESWWDATVRRAGFTVHSHPLSPSPKPSREWVAVLLP